MLPQYHLSFLHYNLLYSVLRWMASAETNQGGRQVGNPRIDAVSAPWHCLTIIQRALGTVPRTDLSLFSLTFPHNNCLQKNWIKWMGNASFQVEMKHPDWNDRVVHKFWTHGSPGLLVFLWIFPPSFVGGIFSCNIVNLFFVTKHKNVADSDGCIKANTAILLESQQALAPKIDSAVRKKEKKCCLPPLW